MEPTYWGQDIQHAGDGMTYIGTRSGSLDNAKAVGNTLQDSGLTLK